MSAASVTSTVCNSRQTVTLDCPNGTYAYFLTDDFPVIPRCLRGTPDRSFLRGPGGPPLGGRPLPRR